MEPVQQFRGAHAPAELFDLVENGIITEEQSWLALVIDSFVNSRGEGCWASNETLARKVRKTIRHMQKNLQRLQELTLVHQVGWKTVNGKRLRLLETKWSRVIVGTDVKYDMGVNKTTDVKYDTCQIRHPRSNGSVDKKERSSDMARRQNGEHDKSAPLLNGDIPPICLQWQDRTHAILRSKKNPAIVMTAISRENGAKYFKELWQRLGENTARIETFLEEYAVKIHRITSPIPSSVRQLCKPEIFNWLERQVLGKSRQVAGSEDNVIN